MSNYVIVGGDLVNYDELMHYGVKGMKWGHRKAIKMAGKRDKARATQQDWEAKYQQAMSTGKVRRAKKFAKKAEKYKNEADKQEGKLIKKAESKYKAAGKAAGQADYYRQKEKEARRKYDEQAEALEKQAAYDDKHGHSVRAYAARKVAERVRAKADEASASYREEAEAWTARSDAMKQKAKDFTSGAKVNIGKSTLNSIMNSSREKGYEHARWNEGDED